MRREISKLYRNAPLKDRIYVSVRSRLVSPEKIEKHLPRKGKIIDLGCGHGIFSNFLKAASPARVIVGYDTDERKIRVARSTGSCKFGVRSAGTIKEKCDAVCMIDLLHHVPYGMQEKIMRNFSGTKTIVIKDIDTEPRIKYLWNYLHDVLVTRSGSLFYRSRKSMKSLVEGFGYRVRTQRINSRFYPHVLYVCKKKEKG